MIARLFRIVALWWRSRRWVACSECGVTLTPGERAHGKEWGVFCCDDCREVIAADRRRYAETRIDEMRRDWRPGMVIPYPSYHALTYSTHDYRIAYFE